MLTLAQKKRPHTKIGTGAYALTRLEEAFRYNKKEDIAWWRDTGVVARTINDPKRSAGLLDAMCRGARCGLDPAWLAHVPRPQLEAFLARAEPDSGGAAVHAWWMARLSDVSVATDIPALLSDLRSVPIPSLRFSRLTDRTIVSAVLDRLVQHAPDPSDVTALIGWLSEAKPEAVEWTKWMTSMVRATLHAPEHWVWSAAMDALQNALAANVPAGDLSDILNHVLTDIPRSECARPTTTAQRRVAQMLQRLAPHATETENATVAKIAMLEDGEAVLKALWAGGSCAPWPQYFDRHAYGSERATVLQLLTSDRDELNTQNSHLRYLSAVLGYLNGPHATQVPYQWWVGGQQIAVCAQWSRWCAQDTASAGDWDVTAQLLVVWRALRDHAAQNPSCTRSSERLMDNVCASEPLVRALEAIAPGSVRSVWSIASADEADARTANLILPLLRAHLANPDPTSWLAQHAPVAPWTSVVWTAVLTATPTGLSAPEITPDVLVGVKELTGVAPNSIAFNCALDRANKKSDMDIPELIVQSCGVPRFVVEWGAKIAMRLGKPTSTQSDGLGQNWPKLMALADAMISAGGSSGHAAQLAPWAQTPDQIDDLIARGASAQDMRVAPGTAIAAYVAALVLNKDLTEASTCPTRPTSRKKM